MNKNIILNIIKTILMITTTVCWYIIYKEGNGTIILTILLPIIAFFMTRYKNKVKNYKFIYNVARKIIVFFAIAWLLITGYVWVKDIFTLELQYTIAPWLSYYIILLLSIMIVESLINIKEYKNNIIIPLCLISLLILIRQLNGIYLMYDSSDYYIYNNSIILFILTFITWINGYIELNRLKLKKEQ